MGLFDVKRIDDEWDKRTAMEGDVFARCLAVFRALRRETGGNAGALDDRGLIVFTSFYLVGQYTARRVLDARLGCFHIKVEYVGLLRMRIEMARALGGFLRHGFAVRRLAF